MSHIQQVDFCSSIKRRFPEYFRDAMILDIGSLDINGNNHYLFEDVLYLGVDIARGRNVDFICRGHELSLPDCTFDLIVSTECFEHDQYYPDTLRNICRLLKPGGMFLFTCATTGRPEHGTRRTTPQDAPLLAGYGEWQDYYANLTEEDVRAAINIDEIFVSYEFSVNAESCDLYFWGIKKGTPRKRTDYSFQVVRPSLHVALEQSKEIAHLKELFQKKENEMASAVQLLEAENTELAKATARLKELLLEKENKTVSVAAVLEEMEATSRKLSDERHKLFHMARTAHLRPIRNLIRFYRWRVRTGFARMSSIGPKKFHERMERRACKKTPASFRMHDVGTNDGQKAEISARTAERDSSSRRVIANEYLNNVRKFKSSQFILKFRSILPSGFVRRMESRMEKNAPYSLKNLSASSFRPEIGAAGAEYRPLSIRKGANSNIKTIAFYLPQFHPIPENDEWWGRGFTEWTNVSKAVPDFEGHYQPRLPGELGFYDLRLVEVQKRQIELAKQYGVSGFCFHYYWFSGGKRLLERPLNQFLENKELDFPFCVCWANENWTRRWDGQEDDVLLAQQYRPEDDIELIKDMAILLRDRRYIRIDGRPLIIVYRVNLLPDPKETARVWREYCLSEGLGDPYLVVAQSFDIRDPEPYGFDAAVEFPPHNIDRKRCTDIEILNPGYQGVVYDYPHVVNTELGFTWPHYKLFKAVMPSWDNSARKPGRGDTFQGSTPALYSQWLEHVARATDIRYENPDEKIVFINAWNEWAEGTYLEPDRKYGYAYLEATRMALERAAPAGFDAESRPVVLVVHDAHPHGAQFLALNLTKTFVRELKKPVEIVLLGGGPLKQEFEALAPVHDLSNLDPQGDEAVALARRLRSGGAAEAICNTTVAGLFLATLKEAGFKAVALIHELSGVIHDMGLESHVRTIAAQADRVLFPADAVARGFEDISKLTDEQRVIRPQGLYKRNRIKDAADVANARTELRQRFGLSENAKIVLGVGHVSPRKGTDLFVEAGLGVLRNRQDVAFIWLGHDNPEMMGPLREQINVAGLTRHFVFPGLDTDTDVYFAGADLFALTSREDPFPSVVMEAMECGLPVVAFAETGGVGDIVLRSGGAMVPSLNTGEYARALEGFLADDELRKKAGIAGQDIVDAEFSFRRYAQDLLAFGNEQPSRVSAIVPNFNYARLLAERIETVSQQSYPVYEILVLDDASTDDSLEVARKEIEGLSIPCRVIPNVNNSGSVFRQWLRGVQEANGDYVWIAEADDLSEAGFLSEVMKGFSDPDVVMSYCQSKQMAPDGHILAADYLDYVSDISEDRWVSAYVEDGYVEVLRSFSVKNTIPNVSAVAFKREALLSVLEAHIEEIAAFRVAGDWLVYAMLLEHGKIAYSPLSLNLHRRHVASVTHDSDKVMHLAEIAAMQRYMRERHPELAKERTAADSYTQKIYEQFELNASAHPHFSLHAAVMERLETVLPKSAKNGQSEKEVPHG